MTRRQDDLRTGCTSLDLPHPLSGLMRSPAALDAPDLQSRQFT